MIVKVHHGIKYLKRNDKKKQSLQTDADEYYGSEVDLIDLMMRADVCVSGNSSTIGDAIRAGTPCVVYAHDLDCFRWKDFHTTQFELNREGWLLACSDARKISETIDQALSEAYREKWLKLADLMFPEKFRTGVEGYLKVIDYFLNDPVAKKYVLLHNYVSEARCGAIEEKDKLIENLFKINKAQKKILDDHERRGLYRIATRIYRVGGRILHVKRKD